MIYIIIVIPEIQYSLTLANNNVTQYCVRLSEHKQVHISKLRGLSNGI